MTTKWTNPDIAGYLPTIFSDKDPRPAAEQIADRYAHGGGYNPQKGFELILSDSADPAQMKYPGDPLFTEQSRSFLSHTNEVLILFDCGYVAIVQPSGDYAVTRMD